MTHIEAYLIKINYLIRLTKVAINYLCNSVMLCHSSVSQLKVLCCFKCEKKTNLFSYNILSCLLSLFFIKFFNHVFVLIWKLIFGSSYVLTVFIFKSTHIDFPFPG